MTGPSAPVVVGGCGTSGGRAFAMVIQGLGVEMGGPAASTKRYHDRDNHMGLNRCGRAYLDLYKDPLDPPEMPNSMAALHGKRCHNKSRWGFKTEWALATLPLIYAAFPHLRIVHVVRNPRVWLSRVASTGEIAPPSWSNFASWCRVNTLCADYAEHTFPDRYLRIRFEDFCRDALQWVGTLAEFLEVGAEDSDLHRKLAGYISAPPDRGLGIYQDYKIPTPFRAVVERFGYDASDLT